MDIHQEGSALFVVPFSRNEQFVGRKGVISKLFAKLSPSPNYHKRLAIAGLGGVGLVDSVNRLCCFGIFIS